MSRHYTETERIKVGKLKAVFFHREFDRPGGSVTNAWLSCGSKYKDQDFGILIEEISSRYHDLLSCAEPGRAGE